MAKSGEGLVWGQRLTRPLAPRVQLVAAPAALYLVTVVGSPDWWWVAAVLFAVGVAWLGSEVLRGRTVSWFALTVLMVGNAAVSILDLVGVTTLFPLWQNIVTLMLGAVVLHGLLTDPTRPRREVREEILRRWPLVMSGPVIMVLFLSTDGDAEAGAWEEALFLAVGLALATWLFSVWRAVRQFNSQNKDLRSAS